MAPSPTTQTATEPPTDASNAASSAKGSSSQSTQSSGTIAGIVVGCALLVALIIGGFFYSGRAKGQDPVQVWQEWQMRAQALKSDRPETDGVALASFGTDNVNVGSNSSRGSDFDHSHVYPTPSRGARDLSPTFVPYVAHRDSRRPSGFSPQTYGMPPPPPGRRASASPSNRGAGYL